jgi:hypothetical protein
MTFAWVCGAFRAVPTPRISGTTFLSLAFRRRGFFYCGGSENIGLMGSGSVLSLRSESVVK